MTNHNTTSPALHHQNQPPDAGSVHESRRRQLWLSLHCSHRHTCCVVLQFSKERRGEVSTVRPPATKSPFLLLTNQNTTSPVLHRQNQPPHSGSVHESQRQQLWLSLHRSHRLTYPLCAILRVFYNFPWERSGTTDLSRRHFHESCHLKIMGQDFAKRAHFRPSENLGKIFRQHFYP